MYSCMPFLSNGDIILTDVSYGFSIRFKQNDEISEPLNLSRVASKIESKEATNNMLRASSKNDGVVAIPRLVGKRGT